MGHDLKEWWGTDQMGANIFYAQDRHLRRMRVVMKKKKDAPEHCGLGNKARNFLIYSQAGTECPSDFFQWGAQPNPKTST